MDLEITPTDDQKQRLDLWLRDLLSICRRYRLALHTEDDDMRIIDLDRGTTIGLGVTYMLETTTDGSDVVTSYICTDSIHDGIWLVAHDGDLVEQRHVDH